MASTTLSSVVRALTTSGSSERLMSMVMAFLAIGWPGQQRHQRCLTGLDSNRIVLDEEFEIFDGLQLIPFEEVGLGR